MSEPTKPEAASPPCTMCNDAHQIIMGERGLQPCPRCTNSPVLGALPAARERLEEWVMMVMQHVNTYPTGMREEYTDRDCAQLRRLIADVIQATRYETGLPF